MKDLVRGAVILSIVGAFVAVFYAQTRSEKELSSAKDSQTKYIGSFIDSEIIIENVVLDKKEIQEQEKKGQDNKDKKLVEKTVSSKATGISKGTFSATAYCLRGKTALGHGVRSGLIAADPRVLKLGSKVNLNAGGYSGTYLVSDTGSRIRGKRLDIWMASCKEARRFGRRNVTVSLAN
ncbi:MAG: 3D domain-containing protein [Pyrinomonadaceae bacterium]